MLSARSDSRRAHNENIYHVIPATGAAIDGRPIAEGKASSYKEIAPGVFVPFTVAGITMKDDGPRVMVAVNPHGHKYVPMLVHHTAAAGITVESIRRTASRHSARPCTPSVRWTTRTSSPIWQAAGESGNGTTIPVHIMAAKLKGLEDLPTSRGATPAPPTRSRRPSKGPAAAPRCPGSSTILVAHEQPVRAHLSGRPGGPNVGGCGPGAPRAGAALAGGGGAGGGGAAPGCGSDASSDAPSALRRTRRPRRPRRPTATPRRRSRARASAASKSPGGRGRTRPACAAARPRLTFVYKCRFGGGVAIVRHDLRSCNAAMAGCQPG